jgi:hypothetical protein
VLTCQTVTGPGSTEIYVYKYPGLWSECLGSRTRPQDGGQRFPLPIHQGVGKVERKLARML